MKIIFPSATYTTAYAKIQSDFNDSIEGVMPQPHYHDYYELFYLCSGKLSYLIDDIKQIHTLKKGDCVCIPPDVLHQTFRTHGQCKRIVITFSREYLLDYFNFDTVEQLLCVFENRIITPNVEDKKRLDVIMHEILNETEKDGYGKSFLLIAEILYILYNSNQVMKPDTRNKIKSLATKMIKYMESNYFKINSLNDLADEFGITKQHIIRLFKEQTNITPIKYLNSIKIRKSCNLLLETDYSIDQISQMVGFNSGKYFCSLFKKITNMTPLVYRKIHQK